MHKCDRLLRIATGLLGSNFPKSYRNLLRKAISLTIKNASDRVSNSTSILIATKELELRTFDATSWYQLSRGLFCLGYFRAAWVARENSLDLSIDEGSKQNSSPTAVRRAVEGHLERLNLDSAENILTSTNVLTLKTISSFRESLRWFKGNFTKNRVGDPGASLADGASKDLFGLLVNGKTVALVGPGQPRGEYGNEIDASEIVARIKFPGSAYLLDYRLFGKRCDISQYPNLCPLRELANLSSYEFFDDLRLIVTGEANSSPIRNIPVYSENQELPMYRTTATSGMRLLVSLIRQGPRSLKVFGYDFYSAREPYNLGMKSFYEMDAWKMGDGYLFGTNADFPKTDITVNFGDHDPVSNFCFAQNLYKAGLFDIEPYGKSILELTPYQYVERLEEMLGDW
ncbi:MAG: hypothetical protein F2712_03385 [Actinobacteria bacterium]|nr:hypothetical protein [Actinomycetota bacterium]